MKKIILLLFFLPCVLKAQDTVLNFNANTKNFLCAIRSYDSTLLLGRDVWFMPVMLKDSTYILPPQGLTNPSFKEVIDSIQNTTWKDSIETRIISDTMLINH